MRKEMFTFNLRGAGAAIVCCAAGLLGLTHAARADVLFNQLQTTFSNRYNSQVYPASEATQDTANVDDFTLPSGGHLTEVDADLQGDYGFGGFSGVTGYRVEIYSSAAAAQGNLTGDLYDLLVSPAGATTTANTFTVYRNGGTVNAPTETVDLPVDVSLSAGTYYLSVLAVNDDSTNGYVFVATAPAGPNGSIAGASAFLANPGGDNGGTEYLSTDAGYRILGAVPEPAGWMIFLVFGSIGPMLNRRCGKAI